MTILKKFITSLALLVFPLSLGWAQQSDDVTSLTEDLQALQFQITENFTLGSFSGSAISYKTHKTSSNARRMGLSVQNIFRQVNYPDSETDQKDTISNLSMSGNYTWMNYVNPDAEIKFYYGYGPGFTVGYNRNKTTEGEMESSRREFNYGLSGLGYTGVEWFFQSSMSFHAEYGASFRILQSHEKQVLNGGEEKERTTTVRLGADGVRFGMSIYF